VVRHRIEVHEFPTIKFHKADVGRAMLHVPRHKFVPARDRRRAYADAALPIGYGQTISQPSLVARMTELLDLHPGDKVLEVGTGCGYQTAVLAELGYGEVYSLEIIPELAETAAARLRALGYTNVHLQQGDGYAGWAEHAPYDAIVVTAAPDHLPRPLLDQLADGGRLVIPIGPPDRYQTLWKVVKQGQAVFTYASGEVVFVPLTGKEGQKSPLPARRVT
jgi:protein-L-isoaspartate(D-aspartate) O-methyltransferase